MSAMFSRRMKMASSPPKDPLIMIIGATGTGKSKLAVEIATRFNGEIINCDAMQMYKGLPIITNKIPESERNGIPHHLLDFIDLRDKPWSVQHFVKQSSRIINEIRARGRLPVVVGGTIYYTFSLLFNDAIVSPDREDPKDEAGGNRNLEQEFPILTASVEEMHAKLKEVDPEMARRWHPNDRTKIRNSLQIFLKHGRKASEIYAQQRQQSRDNRASDPADSLSPNTDGDMNEQTTLLRCPSLLLWLESEDAMLKQRLNDRVDSMVEDGLCEEVVQMANLEQSLRNDGVSVDLTSGIWASIGYKEMKPWLEEQQSLDIFSTKAALVQQQGIEAVKASTRRYAKRQNRFVRGRLAKALLAVGRLDLLFLLDCTDLSRWHAAVAEPAEALVKAFLNGDEQPNAQSLSALAEAMFSQIEEDPVATEREARTCEVCDKVLMTDKEWNGHLVSRSHKKLVAWQHRQLPAPFKEVEADHIAQLPTPPG